jgi:hypothetical protein
MTCDHQWQESGTSKKHDWVCSKCKILYTVLKGLDDDDIQTYVRPWVSLTDDEIKQMGLDNYRQVVREVEAKLRQKNT